MSACISLSMLSIERSVHFITLALLLKDYEGQGSVSLEGTIEAVQFSA